MARAMDEPISPIPTKATRPNSGPVSEAADPVLRDSASNLLDMPSALQERGNGVRHGPHLIFGADRDAQEMRQTVATHLADKDATRFQELAGGFGSLISIGCPVGERNQQEIGDAGINRQP